MFPDVESRLRAYRRRLASLGKGVRVICYILRNLKTLGALGRASSQKPGMYEFALQA
jgi:hypothetical protein